MLKEANEVREKHSFRLSESEKKEMQVLADKYTGGDLSKWIRYSALRYRPKASELTRTK